MLSGQYLLTGEDLCKMECHYLRPPRPTFSLSFPHGSSCWSCQLSRRNSPVLGELITWSLMFPPVPSCPLPFLLPHINFPLFQKGTAFAKDSQSLACPFKTGKWRQQTEMVSSLFPAGSCKGCYDTGAFLVSSCSELVLLCM